MPEGPAILRATVSPVEVTWEVELTVIYIEGALSQANDS